MANADIIRGLVPVRVPTDREIKRFFIPASDGTALFKGDPIAITGTGDTAGFAPSAVRATAGTTNPIAAVVVGFEPLLTREPLKYRAASTACYALAIIPTQDTLFEIQSNAALAITDIGLNASIVFTQAGNTAYGTSGMELDASTKATTATLALKIRSFVERIDNEVGADVKVLVSINNPQLSPAVAGV